MADELHGTLDAARYAAANVPVSPEAILDRVRRCARVDGVRACRGSFLRQKGEMRLAPDAPWRDFRAQEWFLGSGVTFRWRARLHMAPLLRATVADSFEDGRGMLRVAILGMPIVRSSGSPCDRGEAMRGLAELPWRPWAFREALPLSWKMVSAGALCGTFDDGHTRASVEFEIDADGHVLGASVAQRPRRLAKSVVSTPWSGVFRDYRKLDGILVPTYAEASWHLETGKFTYWRGHVTEFHLLG
jgi:hypothetical protein